MEVYRLKSIRGTPPPVKLTITLTVAEPGLTPFPSPPPLFFLSSQFSLPSPPFIESVYPLRFQPFFRRRAPFHLRYA